MKLLHIFFKNAPKTWEYTTYKTIVHFSFCDGEVDKGPSMLFGEDGVDPRGQVPLPGTGGAHVISWG